MQAESYCPYLRSLGLLLVKGPGGIAIWNDYSLFKRTSVLYGSSLKLARVSSSVNEAVFFYGPVFLFSFFSFFKSAFSFHNKRRERERERERPSTEDKMQNKIKLGCWYFIFLILQPPWGETWTTFHFSISFRWETTRKFQRNVSICIWTTFNLQLKLI